MQSAKRFPEGGGSLETITKLPRGTRKALFHAQRAKGTVADDMQRVIKIVSAAQLDRANAMFHKTWDRDP